MIAQVGPSRISYPFEMQAPKIGRWRRIHAIFLGCREPFALCSGLSDAVHPSFSGALPC